MRGLTCQVDKRKYWRIPLQAPQQVRFPMATKLLSIELPLLNLVIGDGEGGKDRVDGYLFSMGKRNFGRREVGIIYVGELLRR